jgi:hypothetical protein
MVCAKVHQNRPGVYNVAQYNGRVHEKSISRRFNWAKYIDKSLQTTSNNSQVTNQRFLEEEWGNTG